MVDEPTVPPVPPFLLRGVARCVDLAVQMGVMEAALRLSGLLPMRGLLAVGDDALFYVDIGVGCVAFLLYTTLAEHLGGATLGKVLTGLRVVSVEPGGGPVGLRGALVRNLGFFVDSLFFGMVAYSHMANNLRRQRLGDEWAGTVVVWKSDAPVRSAVVGWLVGAGAALLAVVASYVLTG